MRIAIPTAGNKLCLHFGHCEKFTIYTIANDGKSVSASESHEAPEHQPGLLPGWIAEKKVDLVIAGGMGGRAQDLFKEAGLKVITGAQEDLCENVIKSYLAGTLVTGANACDH